MWQNYSFFTSGYFKVNREISAPTVMIEKKTLQLLTIPKVYNRPCSLAKHQTKIFSHLSQYPFETSYTLKRSGALRGSSSSVYKLQRKSITICSRLSLGSCPMISQLKTSSHDSPALGNFVWLGNFQSITFMIKTILGKVLKQIQVTGDKGTLSKKAGFLKVHLKLPEEVHSSHTLIFPPGYPESKGELRAPAAHLFQKMMDNSPVSYSKQCT